MSVYAAFMDVQAIALSDGEAFGALFIGWKDTAQDVVVQVIFKILIGTYKKHDAYILIAISRTVTAGSPSLSLQ